ncbi:MAG TPA: YHS domain-containing protein [Thermoanaerobaculia bacterium]|nr:YHS domain-containing protein [Thermoanaerobaculia bacterium]
MTYRSRFLAAAAAAVLLSTPVFAHSHDEEHGKKTGYEAGNCPHHQAIEITVAKALTLVDQAASQNGAQAQTTLKQARQQLTEAQKHMNACEQMCQTKMGGAAGQQGGHAGHAGHGAAATAQAKPEQVTDPVCGMKIDAKTAAGKSVYAGKTYYFCSADEKAKFDKDPQKYLKKG